MQITNLFKVTAIYIWGLILAKYLPISISTQLLSILFLSVFLIINLLLYFLTSFRKFTIFLFVFFFGIINYTWNVSQIDIPLSLDNQAVTIKCGTVDSIPYHEGNRTELLLKINDADSTILNDKTVKLNIYNSNDKFSYGDVLRIEGKLKLPHEQRNPGGINEKNLLLVDGISGIINTSVYKKTSNIEFNLKYIKFLLFSLKQKIVFKTKKYLEPPFDAIFLGTLLGERAHIPKKIIELLQKSGLIHILSVSGLHVGILSYILYLILSIFSISPRIKAGINIFLIVAYGILTGCSAPVMRTALMVSVFHFSELFNRNVEIINWLWLALLLTTIISPLSLFSLSLILSYVITIYLVCLSPKIEPYLDFLPKFLQLPIAALVSAQLGAIPLTLYFFYNFSLISIILNLLTIFLVSIIMACGFAFIIFLFISPLIAKILSAFLWLLIVIFVKILNFFVSLPFAYFSLPRPHFLIIISFFILLFTIINESDLIKKIGIFQILVVLNIFIWIKIFTYNGWNLKLNFVDIGQGDSIFLILPGDKTLLIDGGPRGNELERYLRDAGIFKIDALVITHTDLDHIGGLFKIIENFSIDKIYFNLPDKNKNSTQQEQELVSLLTKLYPKFSSAYQGNDLNISPFINIRIINPKKESNYLSSNDNSLCLQLLYKKFSIIFTGDITQNVEEKLILSNLITPTTILKVAHHGSKYSSSKKFLETIQPEVSIISVGGNNKFGHPDTKTLKNLSEIKSKIYRTDKSGMINITTDGFHYKTEEFLENY